MSTSSTAGAAITALILPSLLKFGRVEIRGFGVFWLGTRPRRQVRNPATKALMWLPESVEVRFRAAKRLKNAARGLPVPVQCESEAR